MDVADWLRASGLNDTRRHSTRMTSMPRLLPTLTGDELKDIGVQFPRPPPASAGSDRQRCSRRRSSSRPNRPAIIQRRHRQRADATAANAAS